ncbi:hypothetical protein BN1058_00834 [Paraliobacillus sp. PM-2]|uniref:DUF438 domain-containing protein n=1 Tax=Paraliobacillus sp. PM-2 TaxID=1462524 RepID=UPI00061C4E71|nr:DUF438 domain-containing protein [Paraliobacillus sp. PM-2]CQR46567.1 hypothetical protein BN1058_00834 [Paraliobacillus sp. PM-2]
MSEIINNRENNSSEQNKQRQEQLKQIIIALHEGKSVEAVKQDFQDAVGTISVEEISALEQNLMEDEGIQPEEVQRLCSVHTAVFKGSIEEIHGQQKEPAQQSGHPVHTFIIENKEIDYLLNFTLSLHVDRFEKEANEESRQLLIDDLTKLWEIDKHYSRKENLLFPYLEKYGINGPTNVMWAVDDFIRQAIKDALNGLQSENGSDKIIENIRFVIKEGSEMIYKEENILLPMALRNLTEDEWLHIAKQSNEIGYCLTKPASIWKPERHKITDALKEEEGYVSLPTGTLSIQQIEHIFNHLPVDLTFIDHNDIVRYFSHGKERIFTRTKSVIGRTVQNCHPPKSMHVVEKLLEDFKSGAKDVEDFWIQLKDKYVLIRYFAIRDKDNNYLGTLEFTQNIAPIQAIDGEKRLLSDL